MRGFLLCLLLVGPASAALAQDEPIFVYHRVNDLVAHMDAEPRLQVFADGRVLITYPTFMKRAGRYETRVNLQELESFLQRSSARQIGKLRSEDLANEVAQATNAKSAAGEYFEIQDDTVTYVEYLGDVVIFDNLGAMRARHPEISNLALLENIVSAAESLIEQELAGLRSDEPGRRMPR